MKRAMIDRSLHVLFGQGVIREDERKAALDELSKAPPEEATRHERNPHDCLALALAARYILLNGDIDADRARQILNSKALLAVPMQVEWGRDDKTGDPWSLDVITSHEAYMEDGPHFLENHEFLRDHFAELLPADFFINAVKPVQHPHLKLECDENVWKAIPDQLPGSWHAFFNHHFVPMYRFEHLDTLRLVKRPGKGKESDYSSQLTLAHSCAINSVETELPEESSGFIWIVQPTPPDAELFSMICVYVASETGVDFMYPSEGVVAHGMQDFLTKLNLGWSPCKTVFYLPFKVN